MSLIASPFALDVLNSETGHAPRVMLQKGLISVLERDGHNVALVDREIELGPGSSIERIARNGAILARAVVRAYKAGRFPVVLGGDCLVALGVCAGLRRVLQQDFGLIWFDTRGDFNTPDTTITGYLGGMPLACICGRGLHTLREQTGLKVPMDERAVVLLGTRDLDPLEEMALRQSPIRIFPPSTVADFVLDRRATYLHIDMDALDPAFAPGVNHPTPGGLSPTVAIAAAQRTSSHLVALSVSAINPDKDDKF